MVDVGNMPPYLADIRFVPRHSTTVPLLPFQAVLLEEEKNGVGPEHLHQTIFFKVKARDVTPAEFRRAIIRLSERHELLRAKLHSEVSEPFFEIYRKCDVELNEIWRSAPYDIEQDSEVSEIASTPFQLGAEFPFRSVYIHVGVDNAVVGVIVHHVISDGVTLGVLTQELAGELVGVPVGIDGNRSWFQFHEAAAQRRAARDEVIGARSRLYLQKLDEVARGDDIAGLDSFLKGSEHPLLIMPFELGGGDYESLVALSVSGITLNVALLAAHIYALAKISGKRRALTKCIWSGRDDPRSAETVGCLIEDLMVFAKFDGAVSFYGLATNIRKAYLDAISIGPIWDYRARLAVKPHLNWLASDTVARMSNAGEADALGVELLQVKVVRPSTTPPDNLEPCYFITAWDAGSHISGNIMAVDVYPTGTMERVVELMGEYLAGLARDREAICLQ